VQIIIFISSQPYRCLIPAVTHIGASCKQHQQLPSRHPHATGGTDKKPWLQLWHLPVIKTTGVALRRCGEVALVRTIVLLWHDAAVISDRRASHGY